MRPLTFIFSVCVPSELGAGLRGCDDSIAVTVASGDPGDSRSFAEFMRDSIAQYYGGRATVELASLPSAEGRVNVFSPEPADVAGHDEFASFTTLVQDGDLCLRPGESSWSPVDPKSVGSRNAFRVRRWRRS